MTIIRRTVVGAPTLGLIANLLTGAFANGAELPKRSVLTLEAAQQVAQAAKKEAADHSWACVIAVVDGEGLLVTVVRMDNAAVAAEEEERSVSKPIVSAGSVRAAPLVFDATRTRDAAAEGY